MTLTLSRRRLGMAALASVFALPALAAAPRRRLRPIGAQLYALGDLSGDKLAPALKGLADIGYRTTELAGYFGHTPQALRRAHEAVGLKCVSAHVKVQKGTDAEPGLEGDLGRVAQDMHALGATYVVVPGFATPPELDLKPEPGEGLDFYVRAARAVTADHWKRRAAFLNTLTERFKGEGLTVGYHNHFGEFFDLSGDTGMAILLRETSPQTAFELDVGWAVVGGVDPAAYLQAHAGRFRMLHVKDMIASTAPGSIFGHRTVAIGEGTTDWRKVLAAADKAGAHQWFVELEPPFEKPRLEMLKTSFDHLAALGVLAPRAP
jgi:sugar phosphate isomerase/epimerase